MGLSEEQQNEVMRAVQQAVPLERTPFHRIAAQTGLDDRDVLSLLERWSAQGRLREISAILEGSALGYESALVAGRVDDADLDRVVEVVNSHPTVTHNYLRNHSYNLWFTIAVPVEMGLAPTLEVLSRLTHVRLHALRRTATYKIGVNFDLKTLTNRTAAAPIGQPDPVDLSPRTELLFRTLQTPLPIAERPFDELAARNGVEVHDLLAFGRQHLGGAMRRYVGTLRHRRLGVRANAMVVWRATNGESDAAGQRLAQAPEISHCYARNEIDGFPYTLYSMIHGPDVESCQEVASRLSGEIGLKDYALLVSPKEYKKTRLRYFLPELDEWWRAHA